jgi:hypothetical protein
MMGDSKHKDTLFSFFCRRYTIKIYCHFILCNPLAFPHIHFFIPQASWCNQWRMFLFVREATYALHPWPLNCLEIGIHMTHLWVVWKYGNQMGWDEIWTACWMGEKFEFQFSNCFNSHCCHMRSSIVMMQNNSVFQPSSLITVKNGFHLLFRQSTIPCTIVCLFWMLAVPKDGPQFQNSVNITFVAGSTLLNFLVLSD